MTWQVIGTIAMLFVLLESFALLEEKDDDAAQMVASEGQRRAMLSGLLARTALGPASAQLGTLYGGIPKMIHSTWHSQEALTGFETETLRSWQTTNPDFEYHFWNDIDAVEFLKTYAPEDAQMLNDMKNIERFDYFRYAILDAYGGVYHDIDVLPVKAVHDWLDEFSVEARSAVRLIAGWEARLKSEEERRHVVFARQDQLEQWVMASAPGHAVPQRAIAHIRAESAHAGREDTLGYTGPGAWTDALVGYVGKVCPRAGEGEGEQNRCFVKDVALLEKEAIAFSGYPSMMGSESAKLATHTFKGSWKS